jgi:DNA-binding beta-propeller fold protein YncE
MSPRITASTQPSSDRSFIYDVPEAWSRAPSGHSWSEVAAVATDSHDRVFIFAREPHAVLIFDAGGSFLGAWGEGLFKRPHGIAIDRDDAVWCTDDVDHTVRKFTPEGRLLLTLGTSGQPSDTGATSVDYRTVRRAAGPFHYPTNLAFAADGTIYVTDGYGNARVHVFTPAGKLLRSWGEPGSGPGQFHLPHGIAIDAQGRVYVADRENSRVQVFSSGGDFLAEWTDVVRPCQVCVDGRGDVYVAELGFRAGLWPGMPEPGADTVGGRVSVFTPDGKLLARWGGGRQPCAAGDFFAPHGICVDSHGDVCVAEVTMSAGGKRGLVPADCHALQKFTRCRG